MRVSARMHDSSINDHLNCKIVITKHLVCKIVILLGLRAKSSIQTTYLRSRRANAGRHGQILKLPPVFHCSRGVKQRIAARGLRKGGSTSTTTEILTLRVRMTPQRVWVWALGKVGDGRAEIRASERKRESPQVAFFVSASWRAPAWEAAPPRWRCRRRPSRSRPPACGRW